MGQPAWLTTQAIYRDGSGIQQCGADWQCEACRSLSFRRVATAEFSRGFLTHGKRATDFRVA